MNGSAAIKTVNKEAFPHHKRAVQYFFAEYVYAQFHGSTMMHFNEMLINRNHIGPNGRSDMSVLVIGHRFETDKKYVLLDTGDFYIVGIVTRTTGWIEITEAVFDDSRLCVDEEVLTLEDLDSLLSWVTRVANGGM